MYLLIVAEVLLEEKQANMFCMVSILYRNPSFSANKSIVVWSSVM